MSQAKNHHYLPRFYLKHFVDPASERVEKIEPYVWVYKAETRAWKRRGYSNAKAVGSVRHLYTFEDDHGPSTRLETEVFSLIDNVTAQIYRKRLLQRAPLEEQEAIGTSRHPARVRPRPLERRGQLAGCHSRLL